MPLTDQIKNLTRKLVDDKPDEAALGRLVRKSMVPRLHFRDNGIIPNHPHWPLLVYRHAVALARGYDPAASIDALGWGRSWRDSIYDFLHYHSQIHEVLGVAKGHAIVEFGGIKGSA